MSNFIKVHVGPTVFESKVFNRDDEDITDLLNLAGIKIKEIGSDPHDPFVEVSLICLAEIALQVLPSEVKVFLAGDGLTEAKAIFRRRVDSEKARKSAVTPALVRALTQIYEEIFHEKFEG